MIVPFGPGTTTDIISRLVGSSLGNELGQALIIENRPGAGGSMGTNAAAKAAADGYTLVMGTVGTHAINVGLYPQLPYDPLKEFAPIGVVGYTPTLLVVPKALPARTVAQRIELARSRPDGLFYASAGNGTSGHLAGELLKTRTGANLTHVPYKEGGMALTDLISGRVEFMFYHPAAVMPHIQKNTLRAIGVSSARRSVAAPEVPTLIEQGIEDFDLVAWFALYAPAATPGSHRAPARRLGSRPRQSQYCQPVAGARGRDFAVEWRSGECVRKERGCQMDRSREDIRRPSGIKCCGLVCVSSCRETTTRRSCREPDVQ